MLATYDDIALPCRPCCEINSRSFAATVINAIICSRCHRGCRPSTSLSKLILDAANRLWPIQRLSEPLGDHQLIILNGREHWAFIDNQASSNIMTLAFAFNNHLKVQPSRVGFLLANGSTQYSTGYVSLECGLSRNSSNIFYQDFYVFPTSKRALVVGKPFLSETRILKPSRSTFQGRQSFPFSSHGPKIEPETTGSGPNFIRLRILRHGLHEDAAAILDKGSSINAMSVDYAETMGYCLQLRKFSQSLIRLGNGTLLCICGTVKVHIELSRNILRAGSFHIIFVVIKGLPFNLLMGNPFITQYKIMQKRHLHIDWAVGEEATLYFMGLEWVKNLKERNEWPPSRERMHLWRKDIEIRKDRGESISAVEESEYDTAEIVLENTPRVPAKKKRNWWILNGAAEKVH